MWQIDVTTTVCQVCNLLYQKQVTTVLCVSLCVCVPGVQAYNEHTLDLEFFIDTKEVLHFI